MGETCDETAAKYGSKLSIYEASSPSGSETCQDVLLSNGICLDPSTSGVLASPVVVTATSSATTLPSLPPSLKDAAVTPTPGPASSADLNNTMTTTASSQQSLTTTYRTTLTYMLGKGTLATPRTIVVTRTTTTVITRLSTVIMTAISGQPTVPSNTSSLSGTTARPVHAKAACDTAAPPAPTQSGVVADCTQWYIAIPGDNCNAITMLFGVSANNFMAWNPAVDAPSCPDMIAGAAYCVATCGGSAAFSALSFTTSVVAPSVMTTESTLQTMTASPVFSSSILLISSPVTTTLTRTSASSLTSKVLSIPPSSTASGVDIYKTYKGDGSIAAGWPAQDHWVDLEYMFTANAPSMLASCAQWGVPDNTPSEMAAMKLAIQAVAINTNLDPRLILAIIMQESTGCVRVITTQYSVLNPGLMQSHNGTGSCNTNSAFIGIIGSTQVGVQTPCPAAEIRQQIQEGAGGTAAGDGLQQCLAKQGLPGVQGLYRAARMYNGGSIDASGDLGRGCCTRCYASDIANRLTGWVHGFRSCDL